MCIVKQACRAGHMVIHSACLLWSITFWPSCPQTSFAICYGVEHWGRGVLHQVYLASGTREGGWPFAHGHVEYDQGGMRAVNHRCSMDSIFFGIPSLESPTPSPLIPELGVSPEVPLDPLVDGSPVCGSSPTRPSSHSPP
jgi:hypothetical protein